MTKGYTLIEVVDLLRQISCAHPTLNTFLYGVYNIESKDNIDYPVLAITVNSATRTGNTLNYNLNLLYADRLTDDRDNELYVQTTGLQVLSEVLNVMGWVDDISLSESQDMYTFTEQFSNNTAGTYTTIQLQAANPIGDCAWIDYECLGC